jgi:predicted secreted Zn-dependent protease
MSRVTILLYLVTQITTHSGFSQGSTSIEWGKPVSYSDFESSPPKADTAAANISVTILLGYSNTKSGELKFRVVAVMDKDQSWMKKEFRKDHILKHEQGHFDIAEIYAKKLDSALKKKRYTAKDVAILNALYDDYLGQMNELQLRYDQETKGGWDGLAQSKWRRFIFRELGK